MLTYVLGKDAGAAKSKRNEDILLTERALSAREVGNRESHTPHSVEAACGKRTFPQPALQYPARPGAQRRLLIHPPGWELRVGPESSLGSTLPGRGDPSGDISRRLAR